MIVLTALAAAVAAPQAAGPAQVSAAATEFYIYTLPLLEVARRRDAFLRAHPANAFVHARDLADASSRAVTTPNNDTLYSSAFIDLSSGPVTIAVPGSGSRYFSLALMDAWSNNFAYFGTRATGGRALTVTLIGPTATAPADAAHVVRSPTPLVWALGRTLVQDAADLPAARALQDKLVISGKAPTARPPATPARTAPAAELHAAALRLMAENPAPPADAAELARFREAGLDRPLDGAESRADAVEQGFAAGRSFTQAAGRSGHIVNDWAYPQRNLGEFGTDYRYRGSVAVSGLAALGRAEAMYLRASPPTPSGLFDGSRQYHLRFAKSEPPVNSFWSLTLYERSDDGGFFFAANPIGRFSVGDRTAGTRRNPDGSIDIWISHADPGPERRANWLPAPAGPFMLTLRTYLPKPELIDEQWRPPAIEDVTAP